MSLPLPPIGHVGYVVDDIDAGVDWAVRTLGAGPFFLVSHLSFDICTFNGRPSSTTTPLHSVNGVRSRSS